MTSMTSSSASKLSGARQSVQRWIGTVTSAGVALVAAIALLWLGNRSQRTELGQELDQAGMEIVVGDEDATRDLVGLLGTISVITIAVVVVLMVAVALARGSRSAAIAAVTLVAGANVGTQIFKRVLDRADFGLLTVPSYPSGHTTVAMSLVLATLLVVPAALRPTVTLIGSAAVTIAGAATLVASWHRPSDILGAILLTLSWGCLVLVGWGALRGGEPHPGPRPHRIFSLAGMVLAAALLVAIGVRPDGGWSGVIDAGVVLGGIGLAAAAAMTTFAYLSAPLAESGGAPPIKPGRIGVRHRPRPTSPEPPRRPEPDVSAGD